MSLKDIFVPFSYPLRNNNDSQPAPINERTWYVGQVTNNVIWSLFVMPTLLILLVLGSVWLMCRSVYLSGLLISHGTDSVRTRRATTEKMKAEKHLSSVGNLNTCLITSRKSVKRCFLFKNDNKSHHLLWNAHIMKKKTS